MELNHRRTVVGLLSLIGLLTGPTLAWSEGTFVRSYDGDVKHLIKQAVDGERQFERSLDGKFKNSVLRSPTEEVSVEKYLQDFQQELKQLSNRFSQKYSASAEARAVLSRATTMNTYMREHPGVKGASEWDQYAGSLSALAGAYDATFPLGPDTVVRRVGDKELIDAVNAASKQPQNVDSALQKAKKNSPALAAITEAGSKDLDELAAALKVLKSRLSSKKPATAEARQVIIVGDRIDALLSSASAPASVTTPWQAANSDLNTIAQTFGLTRPLPTKP